VGKRLKKIVLIATAFMLVGASVAVAEPGYYPEGPQTNVAVSTVTSGGWTLCYSANMQTGMVKETISDACNEGGYVLYAGRAVNSDTLLLAAAAERDIAFTVTATNATNLNNGSYWYFNDQSIGFSPSSQINQNSADTCNSISLPPPCADAGDGALRLSLHSSDVALGGWRIGLLDFLQFVDTHEKLIYVSGGVRSLPLVQISPVTATIDKDVMTCSAGTYKVGMSEVAISSLQYHLYVNDELMSSVVYDKEGVIPDVMKRGLINQVSALVSAKDALFNLSGMSSYSAHCVVEVYGYGSSASSFSNSYQDASYIKAANAKAQAWEDQRAAANAANFTKEARELRKRIAARSGN
jgi:hypothetical protein